MFIRVLDQGPDSVNPVCWRYINLSEDPMTRFSTYLLGKHARKSMYYLEKMLLTILFSTCSLYLIYVLILILVYLVINKQKKFLWDIKKKIHVVVITLFLNFAAGGQWLTIIATQLMTTSKVSLVWKKVNKFFVREWLDLGCLFRETHAILLFGVCFLFFFFRCREMGFFK